MIRLKYLLFLSPILLGDVCVAQISNPTAYIDTTTDSDRDGVPDYLDLDDDNDGILDNDEAFVCGIENADVEMKGSGSLADFSNATIDSYAQITSGNASAKMIAAYGFVHDIRVTKVGRIVQKTGPKGESLKVVSPQYSDFGGIENNKPSSPRAARVFSFAFREDKFNIPQAQRKFVIEYDWYGESNVLYNEWGTYISNGLPGTVYVNNETDQNYKAFASYRSGVWVVNNKRIISRNGSRGQNDFRQGVWYRVKTEYMLESDTALKIKNYMTQYNANGTLESFSGQDVYSHVHTVNINLNGDHSYLTSGFQAGVLSDSDFVNVKMYWAECDTDGDGVPNRFDLDSDNDGCTDAIEGACNMTSLNLVNSSMSGGNANAKSGMFNKPVIQNLGNTVSSDGIPTVIGRGQGIGNAYDSTKQERYCACFKDSNKSGAGLDTNHGITLLKRAGEDRDGNLTNDWPMMRKGAWTVLESNNKGLVVTRMTTNQINSIIAPQAGMITYDTDEKCLKLYNGIKWGCLSAPACPTSY